MRTANMKCRNPECQQPIGTDGYIELEADVTTDSGTVWKAGTYCGNCATIRHTVNR